MVEEDEDGVRSPRGFVVRLDAEASLLPAGFKFDRTRSDESL